MRLIAAAPELLRALHLVLALHEDSASWVPGFSVTLDPKAAEQVRAAIAKAEGPGEWNGPAGTEIVAEIMRVNA